jgi:GNAT superfamily N-acetyltransferase
LPVRSLHSREEFERYVDFAQEVYRDSPHWAPTDKHHLTSVLAGEAGFGPGFKIQPFWVEQDDQILATVTAVNAEAYDRHWNERMGHLVFFEALADQDLTVRALMDRACEWLQAQGCTAARMSILPGLTLPHTIDAYDAVPTIFHTHNPSYYHSYIKNSRFTTERGVVQYQMQFTPELADRYRAMVRQAIDNGVSLRSWDFDRLEEETETFAALGNDSFSDHFGFMPLPIAVYHGLTLGLKDLLVDEFTVFAEVDGQAVGFVYSLPDLNQALHTMKGKAIEENFEEFQQHLNAIDHGALLIIGVKRDYRGRGINLAMAAKSYLAMIDRGYKTGSYTVVMDDNWPSRRTAEKLGGRVTRNFNVYRKALV